MLVYFRLLKESFSFAMNALRNNKLRTFLSLLGVTIGIFSIIAVLTAVDSLDQKIQKDLSNLDINTAYLTRIPFTSTEIKRWKWEQFPNVKYDEYLFLKNNMPDTDEMAFQIFSGSETVKSENRTVKNVNVVPVSFEFAEIQKLEFGSGRFYNESESNSGKQVVVIGFEIAKSLFDDIDPLGKDIRLYGQKFQVIGVLKKQGGFGPSNDNATIIPVNFVRRHFGDNNRDRVSVVIIKPSKGVDMEEYKATLTQKIRKFRGLKAGDEDNFFVNLFAGMTQFIDQIVGMMNGVGWAISGFSLLVGGFGIANIMFVSVKERTNLIGIQKSLGAKNKFILFQFLFEAIILCVMGGVIGLILVWIIALVMTNLLDFEFVLSFWNILLGTSLAAFIGLVSGILPAISASKLDPVEAIRSGM